MVSTVAGTDPAARGPATRQSTLPFLEWMAVPAVFVVAAKSRSVPTAVSGWTPKSSISNGVIREPPPHPGQTDESADNKTGEWIKPVHDRFSNRPFGSSTFRLSTTAV